MKTIEVDEDLYRYIASHTRHIGENASDILRRMLKFTIEQPVLLADKVVDSTGTTSSNDRVRMLRKLLLSDEYRGQRKAVNRFMSILSALYALQASEFAMATRSLHGRTRTYFASDPQTLLRHGTQSKPKQVPGTPWWVITNTNTDRKRTMVQYIMSAMQFPDDIIENVCATL